MKYPNIPFKIGMEYENWEFDLEILPNRLEGYDSYRYVGNEFNNFLNYPTEETELIFSYDILVAVIIKFKYESSICRRKLSNYAQDNNIHIVEVGAIGSLFFLISKSKIKKEIIMSLLVQK